MKRIALCQRKRSLRLCIRGKLLDLHALAALQRDPFDGVLLCHRMGNAADVYKRQGVDRALEAKEGATEEALAVGAGDQGMMFGYASDETPELMPMAISFAHKLAKRLSEVRKAGILPYLRPDGKTQVTVEYRDDRPVRVDTVVVSTQHSEETPLAQLRKDILEQVIRPVIPAALLRDTKYYINPTGRFVIGGPQGDSGLTGRKIIVDSYGGYGRHGGGAFSGKDPTKVDRSAAYAAVSYTHLPDEARQPALFNRRKVLNPADAPKGDSER